MKSRRGKDKIKGNLISFEKGGQRQIVIDERSVIDLFGPGQNQPDRQEVMGVAGIRQGQRSHRVTLFTLRD